MHNNGNASLPLKLKLGKHSFEIVLTRPYVRCMIKETEQMFEY